ncbi:MAG: deoxyribodipyrimidine photo-lyase, partial [Deltaproteobacteria bacterium]|nr:deoxyribodipyrimidine photo-lyase [Deltaproteobacteria bacterium]
MSLKRGKFCADILWFRRDLRTDDNPILSKGGGYVLPVFIFDKDILKRLKRDDPRVTYIFESVKNLKRELKLVGLDLLVFYGRPSDVFGYLSSLLCIRNIYAVSDNDLYSKKRDYEIGKRFRLNLINDAFLIQPEKVFSKDGKVYTVFSHFRNAVADSIMRRSYEKYIPETGNRIPPGIDYDRIIAVEDSSASYLPFEIESIGFVIRKSSYIGSVAETNSMLNNLEAVIRDYEKKRDIPSLDATSHLGCALRFGRVSVREVVRRALRVRDSSAFINELIWREFFSYLLFHFPESEKNNFKNIQVRWKDNRKLYERWKSGETGIPFVDAGMRQLLREGFIHNRVRMIVAGFLTKNLHIRWQSGEEYFAEMLMDYEISSNTGNWQWVSGTGADPKSLYRTFN